MLPLALADNADNLAAALQELAALVRQTLDELRQHDPATFARLEAEVRQTIAALLVGDQTPDEATASTATTDAPVLMQALAAFLSARTWIDSYREVQSHPELLSDEALAMLDQAIAATRAANDADAVAFFEEHRALLRRCREIGAAAAFAEKIGVSEEELEMRTSTSTVPAVFTSWLATAQQMERRFLQTGDRNALSSAVEAWRQILEHPAFQTAPPEFRCAVLNNAGGAFLRRYWAQGQAADLERALNLWTEALDATSPDSPDRPGYLNNLGTGLRARYARSGRLDDLEEARNRYAQACQIGQTLHPEAVVVSSRSRGNWALQRRAWDEVVKAYAFGRQATDTLFAVQTSRVAKESWLREAQGLPASAAYALAQLNRLEEAIVALETGRARLLAEALEANRRDLERLPALGHGDLLALYRAETDRLAALQAQIERPAASGGESGPRRDFVALSQEIQAARAELDATMQPSARFPATRTSSSHLPSRTSARLPCPTHRSSTWWPRRWAVWRWWCMLPNPLRLLRSRVPPNTTRCQTTARPTGSWLCGWTI